MKDRGMMKWAPYKSLNEQEDFLIQMKKKKEKIPKPVISSEEAENINQILSHYHQQEVTCLYYEGGSIVQKEGVIEKIDVTNHYIIIDEIRISFSSIYRLKDGETYGDEFPGS